MHSNIVYSNIVYSNIMYSNIIKKARLAKSTGTSTCVQLVRQQICIGRVCPPVYHVALLAQQPGGVAHVFEHGPVTSAEVSAEGSATSTQPQFQTIVVPLPTVWNSIDDILAFEATLPRTYIVGFRDCRHHVLDLLDYLYYGDLSS
jgi:hypothetical protein